MTLLGLYRAQREVLLAALQPSESLSELTFCWAPRLELLWEDPWEWPLGHFLELS